MIYHVHVKGKKGYAKLFSVEADEYELWGGTLSFRRTVTEKKLFQKPVTKKISVATMYGGFKDLLILPYELETPCQSRPTEQ